MISLSAGVLGLLLALPFAVVAIAPRAMFGRLVAGVASWNIYIILCLVLCHRALATQARLPGRLIFGAFPAAIGVVYAARG